MPVPGIDAIVMGQVIVGVNNAGARLMSARSAPNLIGVYEVAFQIPRMLRRATMSYSRSE